jgi:D-alanyl-D-alanine carboxypeptidase/D-alanyl-D-alanine-endopeptidase (penicillin-binding protein 4)
MDPHGRRRATAAAAGLTCVLAAGLWGAAWLLRPRPAAASDVPRPGSAAPADPARAPARGAEAPRRRVAPDPALVARIRGRIADFENAAARETKGKVGPKSVAVAVHVLDLDADGELVAIDADRSMRPASNLKLVTSSAALVLLGPAFSFETVFETQGAVEGGVLAGDLVARAAGDPLYDRQGDGSLTALLAPLVADLARRGIRRIDGALVLDELDFAEPSPGPAWPDAGQRWSEFCALAGGFSANAGCLTATVRPRGVGEEAEVRVEPRHDGLARKGRVVTGAARSRLDVRVEGRHGQAFVDGSIPAGVGPWSTRFAAADPVELFGAAVVRALKDGGIPVRDGWTRAHATAAGRWTELGRIVTPIGSVLEAVNTDSNNACADQVFLALGHAQGAGGTRAGGRAAVASALDRLGVSSEGLVQVDGSGLSRDNRVTARQITALVRAVLRLEPGTARAFVDSLAVAGETGTLDDRMDDPLLAGNVRAKTGFIAGTSALSGILDTRDGRRLVFSILVEYPPTDGLNKRCWKPLENSICKELAGADG